MSYWVVKNNSYNNSKYFQCDYISDIEKLPTITNEGVKQNNDTVSCYRCAPGSQCLCQEDGSIWLLGKDTNSWTKQKNSGSGSIYFSDEEPESFSEGQIWIGD